MDIINDDEDITRALDEFEEVVKIASRLDISKLPFTLQISLIQQYMNLTRSIKSFNEETKKIIVVASVLGRS